MNSQIRLCMRKWTRYQELSQLWTAIQKEVSSRRSSLWTPTVATADAYVPKQRTMVLRELPPYNLIFFTDRRSNKCGEIDKNESISVHSYNPRAKTQIQFSGTGLLTTDHPKFEQWRLKGLKRAQDYATINQPGSTCSSYTDIQYNLDLASTNFTLLIIKVNNIELLRLGNPHERCQWTRLQDDRWHKEWLVP